MKLKKAGRFKRPAFLYLFYNNCQITKIVEYDQNNVLSHLTINHRAA